MSDVEQSVAWSRPPKPEDNLRPAGEQHAGHAWFTHDCGVRAAVGEGRMFQ